MKRLRRAALGVLLFFLFIPLSARGKAEEERPPINTEFVLWVTAIDVSELPPSQQVQGLIFQRELVNRLRRIDRRTRSTGELNRYEELAWNAARREAAGKLAEKRLERDGLYFQGLPQWKYKRELKRIDGEIAELEAAYAKADEERPIIEDLPVFVLKNTAEDPEQEQFPLPPEPGKEEAFLAENSADALSAGRMRGMYGRVYLELSVYTRGGAFSYEKAVVYSPEDMPAAADELKEALASAVSGTPQALLRINADPADAQVLVNGNLVHSGEDLAVNPGEVIVSVKAEGRRRVEIRDELEPGEEASYDAVLIPLEMEKLGIEMPGIEDAVVYLGALYVGRLSDLFELEIPEGYFTYINAETEGGSSKAIVLGGQREEPRIITFKPEAPPAHPEKNSVETLRRKFYGAYGRFWIALPLAFLANGLYQTNSMGYSLSSGSRELYDSALNSYYLTVGAWIGAGIFLAESLIRLVIYVRAADKEAVPLYE